MRLGIAVVAGVGLLCVLAAPAAAQTDATVGVEGGVTISHVAPAASGQTDSYGAGLLAGVFGYAPVSKTIGVLIEADYWQKHGQVGTTDLNLDYIEVPVMAKLPLFKGLYMTEGVGFGFPVRAQLKTSGGAETDIKDSTTSPDVGIIIGGGFAIQNVGIELRYDGGFRNVSTLATAAAQKNRSWAVLLRWHKK